MKRAALVLITMIFVGACATKVPGDLLDDYEEVDATTILDAPAARPGSYSPQSRARVERGEYLVELLGCGSCHTDGALIGDPDFDRPLAGSRTGIAYANPLGEENPGVVFPSNITPEDETGIGKWTDTQ
ncbi:MAG: hypothetical protein WBM34_14940, partial [Woeseiaceae bacterium]